MPWRGAAIAPRCSTPTAPGASEENRVQQPSHASRNIPKSSQILPTGPSNEQPKHQSQSTLGQGSEVELSFGRAFGVLGIPMLFTLMSCLIWTSWLIFLALEPNKAANLLMGTSSYDNGRFWMIHDDNLHITRTGIAGLVLVAVYYLAVMLRMLFWRDKLIGSAYPGRLNALLRGLEAFVKGVVPSYGRIRLMWADLTAFEGKNRKRWNAFLKLIDLSMETAMLLQLLQNGSPVSLIYGYAGFLATNALSCVTNVIADRFSALTEVFIDSVFDLSAAVLYPIITLVYCYYNFDFDKEVFLTYLEKLPPGSFEHSARTFADPSELALFRVSFDSLRINSLLDFALRISMNLTFCYRFERVLETLVRMRLRDFGSRQVKMNTTIPSSQKSVPKVVAGLFAAASLAVLLVTHEAISDSKDVCSAYPECVVYVHRWSNNQNCPCLILIDVDLAPLTYEEWTHPIDAFDKVQALATAGSLTSIQVINRQLLEWPDELRNCRNLHTIHLIYTRTQHIPPWAKELKHLETVQIEGKADSVNLLELPADLFSDLPRLSSIHLGLHPQLKQIPALTGVPNLQSLVLAFILELHELPSLEYVPKLNRLVLSRLLKMERMPDLSPLKELDELVIYRPNQICCNGFIGPCDLTHPSCQAQPLLSVPEATCLKNSTDPNASVTPFLGNAATENAFKKFAPAICQPSPFDEMPVSTFPAKELVEMCDGKPYRQCQVQRAPGQSLPGLCYNTRLQVLSCLADNNYIELRKLQIEKGIGPKCDPVEEKWLGC